MQTQLEFMNNNMQLVDTYADVLINYVLLIREMEKAKQALEASDTAIQQSGIEFTVSSDNPYSLRLISRSKQYGMNYAESLDMLSEVVQHMNEIKAQ